MYELNLWDYGQLKQGQLGHVSVVVIGAVHQIVWLSTWLHCISWLPYVWVEPLTSSGQSVVIESDVCYFRSGMLICQWEPLQGSLSSAIVIGNILHCQPGFQRAPS